MRRVGQSLVRTLLVGACRARRERPATARTPTRSPPTFRESKKRSASNSRRRPSSRFARATRYASSSSRKSASPPRRSRSPIRRSIYKLLGMLPDTMHLADFYVKVLTEQIIGYYDPKTKVLYVVDGAPEDYVGITIMHELVHALQDQYVESRFARAHQRRRRSRRRDSSRGRRPGDVRADVHHGRRRGESRRTVAGRLGIASGRRFATRRDAADLLVSADGHSGRTLLFPYINGSDFVRRFKARQPGKLPFGRSAGVDRSS